MTSCKRNSPITQYFYILNRNWQQLDMFENHKWKFLDDALYYKKIVEQRRLYKFFIRLNKNLDDVCDRILSKRPLPSLWESFAEVRHEDSRKKVMLGKPNQIIEASAMDVRGGGPSSNSGRYKTERPRCDHYHKRRHTKERCWNLHGRHDDSRGPSRRVEESKSFNQKESRGNFATSEENSDNFGGSFFSNEQLDILQKLLGQ